MLRLENACRKRIESKGAHSDKVHVIPNWADGDQITLIKRDENQFIAEHQLQQKFIVFYSGNMGKVHDFDTILQSARDLSEHGDIAFVFVGDGPKKDLIERFVKDNPACNILLLPYRSRDELSVSLGAADVSLVCLSDGMQGLVVPSKVYGVMAAGRPVIFVGPSDSEAADTIRDADCGYVVPNGDVIGLTGAILRLRGDKNLASQMGNNSRSTFEKKFDRRIITRRYFDLIKGLTEANNDSRRRSHLYATTRTTDL